MDRRLNYRLGQHRFQRSLTHGNTIVLCTMHDHIGSLTASTAYDLGEDPDSRILVDDPKTCISGFILVGTHSRWLAE